MKYTKIAHRNEPWMDAIVEDLNMSEKKAMFVLVERFSVYPLKVLDRSEFGTRMDMFLIQGLNKKEERCIVTLEIDTNYNMVVKSNFKRTVQFDDELCYLLKMALLVRLKNTDAYYFSARILPDLK